MERLEGGSRDRQVVDAELRSTSLDRRDDLLVIAREHVWRRRVVVARVQLERPRPPPRRTTRPACTWWTYTCTRRPARRGRRTRTRRNRSSNAARRPWATVLAAAARLRSGMLSVTMSATSAAAAASRPAATHDDRRRGEITRTAEARTCSAVARRDRAARERRHGEPPRSKSRSSQPTPRPSSRRPPERTCTERASWASTVGLRSSLHNTCAASVMRSVATAAAASSASGAPRSSR